MVETKGPLFKGVKKLIINERPLQEAKSQQTIWNKTVFQLRFPLMVGKGGRTQRITVQLNPDILKSQGKRKVVCDSQK